MPLPRRRCRTAEIGDVVIGGDRPIAVQSMTNTRTEDVGATLAQIRRLKRAGCEIVRIAVRNADALRHVPAIRDACPMPLVCDIHFDHNLALACIEYRVAKIRINPGNLGSARTRERLFKAIVIAAGNAGVALRIGVNAGSLERDLLDKYGHPTPDALVESALRWLESAERAGGRNIVLSIKSSDVAVMVESTEKLAAACDAPLHLGVTEVGPPPYGAIKSAAGLAPLLLNGIGDTIRVSLLAPPEDEIPVCYDILQAVGRRSSGPEIIACPACGRVEIDLDEAVSAVRNELAKRNIVYPMKISVLGCIVNGPGEAREADVGVALGRGGAVVFRNGNVVRRCARDEILPALFNEIEAFIDEKTR